MTTMRPFLPFALPDIDTEEIELMTEAARSGWVTTGPQCRQFEAEFAAAVGCKHALAVNSCTAAMHLALDAMGLNRGDEVITTPYTFAATAEVVRYFDAKPVFVDVDPLSLNIDPELVERAITPKTKAMLPVHIAGLPAELDPLQDIARKHGVHIVEDAAHAFPSKYKGRMIGTVSEITCFSFYATKTITTGEGGMICTDDDECADRCRIMALHGISKDAWKRYTAEGSWYYEIIAPGYKYNMTDIAAAMGLGQLRKAEAMWKKRCAIASLYDEAFARMPELQTPFRRADSQHAWHLYMLRLNGDSLKIDRGRFVEELKARNIGASVHFIPLHVHPYYRELYGLKSDDYPVAYREYLREVSLPIYSKMSDEDVRYVITAVQEIVEQNRK
jgi:dTDP-4-amino-4,6-dideoxygalactose transaminase